MSLDFINPEEILDQIQLRSEMKGAEFGCGSGHWALALAQRLKKGIVYAMDVQAEPLSALKAKAERAGFANLKVRQRDLTETEGSGLPKSSLDIVLIPNLLFQVEEKEKILREAKRILKPNGLLVVVDWLKRARLILNQPYISAAQVKSLAHKLGFALFKEFPSQGSHFVLVFKKENE